MSTPLPREIGKEEALEFFRSIDFFERFVALQDRFPWDGNKDTPAFPIKMIMDALRARVPSARFKQKKVRYGHSVWMSVEQDEIEIQLRFDFMFGRIEPFFSSYPIEGSLTGPLQYLSRELRGEPAIIPPAPKSVWQVYHVLDELIDIAQDYIDGVRRALLAPPIYWHEQRITLPSPKQLKARVDAPIVLGRDISQKVLFEADYKVNIGGKPFTVTPAFLENLDSFLSHIGSYDFFEVNGVELSDDNMLFYRRDRIIAAFNFIEIQPQLFIFELTHAWVEE